MYRAIEKSKEQIRHNTNYINSFKRAVYWVAQSIDDHDQLKGKVHDYLFNFVQMQGPKNVVEDSDINDETKAQMAYCNSMVKKLKDQLEAVQSEHRKDNQEVMQRNQQLIKSISVLREEVKVLNESFNKEGGMKTLNEIKKQQDKRDRQLAQIAEAELNGGKLPTTIGDGDQEEGADFDPNLAREIKMKKAYIDELRQRMLKLQQDNSKIKMNGMGQYAQQMSDPNM